METIIKFSIHSSATTNWVITCHSALNVSCVLVAENISLFNSMNLCSVISYGCVGTHIENVDWLLFFVLIPLCNICVCDVCAVLSCSVCSSSSLSLHVSRAALTLL